MGFVKFYSVLFAMAIFGLSGLSHADSGEIKTPSHVFQQAKSLEMDIMALVEAENMPKGKAESNVQINKLPVHVFAKATEVNQKIIRLQKQLGVTPSEVRKIPVREITPSDVYAMVSYLRLEISPILEARNISPAEAGFVDGKTPSNAYEQLMKVSLALDSVIGRINSNLVYQNVQQIQFDLDLISEHLEVKQAHKQPNLVTDCKELDVNIEAFKNLYRIAKLERRLGMESVRVEDFPVGEITSSEVFDTTHSMIAELTRIKAKLNLTQEPAEFPVQTGKQTAEVYQLMQSIGLQLEAM